MKVAAIIALAMVTHSNCMLPEDFEHFYLLYGISGSDRFSTEEASFDLHITSFSSTSDDETHRRGEETLPSTSEHAVLPAFMAASNGIYGPGSLVDSSFNSKFCKACHNGDYETVKTLLANPQVDPAALDNEALLSACANNNLDVIQLLLADPRVDPGTRNNKAMHHACKYADADVVELLLSHPQVDPSAYNNTAIQNACQTNESCFDCHRSINSKSSSIRLKIVKLLLADDRVDPGANNNAALISACSDGLYEIVQLLLPHSSVDPAADDNKAFRRACQYDHVDIVKLLLSHPKIDPTASDNEAIIWASVHGNSETVKLLLEDGRADPSAEENKAIRSACEYHQLEVVKLLLSDPRVDPSAMDSKALAITLSTVSIFHTFSSILRCQIAKLLLSDPRVDPGAESNEITELIANLKEVTEYHEAGEMQNELEGLYKTAHSPDHLTTALIRNDKIDPNAFDSVPVEFDLILKTLMGFVHVSKIFDKIDPELLKQSSLDLLSPWELDIIAFRNQHDPEIVTCIFQEQLKRLYIPEHIQGTPLLTHFMTNVGTKHLPIQFEDIQRGVMMISSITKGPFAITGISELDAHLLFDWTLLNADLDWLSKI